MIVLCFRSIFSIITSFPPFSFALKASKKQFDDHDAPFTIRFKHHLSRIITIQWYFTKSLRNHQVKMCTGQDSNLHVTWTVEFRSTVSTQFHPPVHKVCLTGFEPAHPLGHQILSLACLPSSTIGTYSTRSGTRTRKLLRALVFETSVYTNSIHPCILVCRVGFEPTKLCS